MLHYIIRKYFVVIADLFRHSLPVIITGCLQYRFFLLINFLSTVDVCSATAAKYKDFLSVLLQKFIKYESN